MMDSAKAKVLHAKEPLIGRRRKDHTIGGGEAPAESKSRALNYGCISLMGRRRVMEDVLTVVPPRKLPGECSFFAAYDAHGGAKASETCNERLHECLEKQIQMATKLSEKKGFDWGKMVMECFSRMYEEMSGQEMIERDGRPPAVAAEEEEEEEEKEEERMMKFTAVVVGKEEVVVVNYGGSRAVLWSGGVALPLWNDHQPDEEDERVEAARGRIISWIDGRVSTSRLIGDHHLKPYTITEQELTVVRRMENSDDFLIIATDGLWNVVSKEIACEVVRKCLGGKMRRLSSEESSASQAAAILAVLAIAKGSRDNISIIIVQLK